ncbi:MAG: lysostaphin resistance A-like protein [Tenacibaculum sp.]
MLGLLVIIVISWGLLRFIEKKNIDVIGIIPTKKRSIQFIIGFLFITLVCFINILIESWILEINWQLNPSFNYKSIANAFVYHIRSALTEDLVFRGALLYILIQKIGAKKGGLIAALIFGIYHIFSYGILGEKLILMLYVTLITGCVGYVWGYTFHKTNSIMMGLGFHLGYNFIMALFFASNPYGELLFEATSKISLSDWNWLFFNLFKGLFPSITTFLFVKQYLKFNQSKN